MSPNKRESSPTGHVSKMWTPLEGTKVGSSPTIRQVSLSMRNDSPPPTDHVGKSAHISLRSTLCRPVSPSCGSSNQATNSQIHFKDCPAIARFPCQFKTCLYRPQICDITEVVMPLSWANLWIHLPRLSCDSPLTSAFPELPFTALSVMY